MYPTQGTYIHACALGTHHAKETQASERRNIGVWFQGQGREVVGWEKTTPKKTRPSEPY